MEYYGAAEIARSFRTVRKNTLQLATELPEDQYAFAPAPSTRTVGQTLVHIAVIPRVQREIHGEKRLSTLAGFDFFGFMGTLIAEEQKPRTKAEILALLTEEGERYASFVEAQPEAFLAEIVAYPPGMEPAVKSRFEMLISPKEHEMHHRGQLMLVQRLLGQTPHLTRHMQARIAEMQKAAAAQ